ncbi:MAG: TadE/TadG family type IV pilus assembly protein [Pseudomonadota bacterium]
MSLPCTGAYRDRFACQENLRSRFTAFRNDEQGGMFAFTIVLFLLMVVSSGMAIDFMRHEMARADLQNALDRGVLAATNMEQTLADTEADAKTLVLDYMKSRSYKTPNLKVDVKSPVIAGGRRISATASYDLDTFFLHMIGFDEIGVAVANQAEQAASDIEISLILDVSGSMTQASSWNAGGTRLTDLQEAAHKFVDTVMTDENKDRTAMSIVPYSAQVNLSDTIASAYNIDRHHEYANCVNFVPNDYSNRAISTSASLPQTEHFSDYNRTEYYWVTVTRWEWVYTRWGWRQRPVRRYEQRSRQVPANFLCPDDVNQVVAFSNNKTDLKKAITDLVPENWTAAYTGMKWGVALLDPSASPVVDKLIQQGKLSSEFSGWPRSWTDGRTRKIIVLMSDGRNTIQYRPNAEGYASQTPEYWNSNGFPSSWLEKAIDNENDGKGDEYLKDICDAAKQSSNAIIYTIGFELQTSAPAAAALADCASSPSTAYLVEGVNIDLAFSNIAAQIENLKLTR